LRRTWIAVGVLVATLLALGGQTVIAARTGFLAGDFRAFYCASRVASYGHDPYRTQPLDTCENGLAPKAFFPKPAGVTIPAPLPGYAIAALMPFARLPFAIAATIWTLALLAAWIAGAIALSRFARVPWELGFAVLGLSLGVLSLPFGELTPVAIGCTCLAAYFAYDGRWRAAAIASAATMIEPHLGLPICVALAIYAPASRLALAVCAAILAALSLVALGPAINVEYFTSVLPAHALSELTKDTQYSLSAVLAAFGMAPALALRAGILWYVAMVAAGVYAGGTMARRTGNAAWIACAPAAFAVFGGTFIHITQIAAAVPAALLLATTAPSRYRTLGGVALLALIVPWGWTIWLVAPTLAVGYVAANLWKGSLIPALISALIAAAFVAWLNHLNTIATPHFGAIAHAFSIDPNLPEASWSALSQRSSHGTLAIWVMRLPTWTALALLLVLIVRTVREGRRVVAAAQPACV
jgi:hypothetical protein